MKYVYVYLDSEGFVRYVGCGAYDRMYSHTKPSQLNRGNNNSPFFEWLRSGPEFTRFRVVGPVEEGVALAWEHALILEHFDTVLNVRAAGNGQELRPAARPKRGKYRPRVTPRRVGHP